MTTAKRTASRAKAGPKTSRRRSNGVATRKRIIETASTMFASTGYEATSLRQIAASVGIDIATLKYHFGDKPSLYAEVYRIGHEAMLAYLQPCLAQIQMVDKREALIEALGELVRRLHDFVESHLGFMRMVVYRMLEGSEAIIAQEESLQIVATDLFDQTLQTLQEKGLIRQIDMRAFVSLLISAFSTWFVLAEAKPQWLKAPAIFQTKKRHFTADGRKRSEAFFNDLMKRMLLV